MPRTLTSVALPALCPAALLLVLAAATAQAQVGREQAAHAHGTTGITLAVVDGALELALVAPGTDLVGFEHAPRDAQQAQAIAAATASLERNAQWLVFEPAGSCTIAAADAHTQGFGTEPGTATHGAQAHGNGAHPGNDDGDHDGGHEHAGHDTAGGHGEFHLRLTGTCGAIPQALRFELGARFPGIERIRVDLITDSVQDRVELAAGQTRVPLAR